MSDIIKIKKGVDIKLKGKAEQIYKNANAPQTIALKPTDFPGIQIKLEVKEGDKVKAGDPVFYHKDRPNLKFSSPISGEVVEVLRGAKRKLLEVRILADSEISYTDFGSADPTSLSSEEITLKMMSSGCWPLVRQRPYNIVANPEKSPRDIYISSFDSAPLAADLDFMIHGMENEFQTGINALSKLTTGKIHLGIDASTNPSKIFTECKNVVFDKISGPHPAGNVGVQIHHTQPINKGETIWTVNAQDVVIIGRLFLEGRFNAAKNIAISGSEVKKPAYVKSVLGANISEYLKDNLSDNKNRVISGNVLTGTRVSADGFLGYYDNQITVLPEGETDEFFGWIAPGLDKFSISRALFSWMSPKERALDTGMHGEERAFVVTGEYEKVFPFDIFPVQLLKSIMMEDIEAMENLGIYEVVEEDMALCEVVCTSKTPVQETLRKGLDLMLKELGD